MSKWNDIVEAAVAFRHELHRHPELTWAEADTARRIRDALTSFVIPWRVCAEYGTVGTLAPDAPGRHIALRADIDALPIAEENDIPWRSEVAGCMHACGHDGHTATLLAASRWLKLHEDALPGPVSLLFQPAEEGGHGAKRMIEDGALEGVEAIYGWHNWPAIALGQAVCPDGPVMAANATFVITVEGRGGHASQPELCADPVLAASAITLALQQIVSRRLAPQDPAVVSVTSIEAPSGQTVTPERAVLGGSIRVADTAQAQSVGALITQIAEDTARSYGVSAKVEMQPRYGATVNHAAEAGWMREALAAEFGADWHAGSTRIPIMASEDFHYYLNAIPGAFALIGASDDPAHAEPCHSPRFDFNDALLPRAARVLVRLAGGPEPPDDS